VDSSSCNPAVTPPERSSGKIWPKPGGRVTFLTSGTDYPFRILDPIWTFPGEAITPPPEVGIF